MKKAKINKVEKKQANVVIEESYSIKNLIYIVLIIVAILGIFYFITTLVVKPVKLKPENTITEFDSTKITLNNLLDRKEKEYYVLATMESLYDSVNSKIKYSELYNNYITEYSKEEDSLPFYTINLDDALNKNYISDKTNISSNINEIKLNDEVLFKIKDKKIEEYYVGNKDILKILSSLKES